MVNRLSPPTRRARRVLVLLACVLLSGSGARAEEEGVAWQPTEVARVAGEPVTWDALCRAAVDHLAPALRVPESTASSVLARLIREQLVAAECARRGIEATDEELEAAWQALDARTRAATGDAQGLLDVMAEHVVARSAVRARLADEVRGRKLLAAGVSLAALEETAGVRVFLPTARGPAATDGPPDAVLQVEGRTLDRTEVGRRLLANLGAGRVRSILDAECRARLAAPDRLDPEAMLDELRFQDRLAALEARFDPEPVWETVFVHRGRTERHERTAEELPESPYARSLFGLLRRFREALTPVEVRRAWQRGREGVWGPHVLAVDLEIRFRAPGDAAFGQAPTRTRGEALQLARALRTELAGGADVDEVAARYAGDADVAVRRLRLYGTDRNRLLLDRAFALADGQLDTPFETLSEVHVLRREARVDAPPFEEVEALVRERLAREQVRQWLDARMADPEVVRLRWPLPLMP